MFIPGIMAYIVGFLTIDGGYLLSVLICITIWNKASKWAKKRHKNKGEDHVDM